MIYLLLSLLRNRLIDWNMYGWFSVLDQVQFRALFAAFLSFTLVLAFGRRTIQSLVRLKIGDSGATDAVALAAHSNSKANTPTMGGVLIVGAILVSTLLLADITHQYIAFGLVVMLWFAGIGGADDWLKLTAKRRGGGRQGLYAWEKLVFQLGGAMLVSWFLYRQGMDHHDLRHVLNLPFQKTYVGPDKSLSPGLVFLPWSAFVLIGTLMMTGMSNAVNIADGMDGLAAGSAAAVSVGLFVLSMIAGDLGFSQYLLVPHVPGSAELSVLVGATVGACLGFLWWNCWPAQVFMGDVGALAIGGVFGYVAVVLRQEAVVILMSGVFIAEIASSTIQVLYFKASGGKRFFRCAPLHHHLHLGGWPEQMVVTRMWIISIILVVLGLASLKIR